LDRDLRRKEKWLKIYYYLLRGLLRGSMISSSNFIRAKTWFNFTNTGLAIEIWSSELTSRILSSIEMGC
jgi:hypothetical protein